MDAKLVGKIAVKGVIAGALIMSALGDIASTRLTAEDGKQIWEAATDDERRNMLDLGGANATD